MKTEVNMIRKVLDDIITQKSKQGFFSAAELVKFGNKWRAKNDLPNFVLSRYLRTKSFREFKTELERRYGEVVYVTKGAKSGTWVHPLIFIDIALSINPKLKVDVYSWVHDNLLKFRNDSGDSYKEMCGALYARFSDLKRFPKFLQQTAIKIRIACLLDLNSSWEEADELQLEKRDKIHNLITANAKIFNNAEDVVEFALKEYEGFFVKKNYDKMLKKKKVEEIRLKHSFKKLNK